MTMAGYTALAMPIVYACICPTTLPEEDSRAADALRRVADELSGYEPELVLFIAPAASGATKVGVFAVDHTLAERLVAEAKKDAVPVEQLLRWSAAEPPLPVATDVTRLSIATCSVDVRQHFEFGQAAARAFATLDQRVAIVCAVGLSKDGGRFDEHYRRALASWDVKSMVNMDAPFRRTARERAVAQTALLMGVLGGYRLQTRVLSSEAGQIVVAIDVLGSRRGSK